MCTYGIANAGSSVGSIVAAIAAVHTDSELRTLYSNIEDFNLSFFANNSALDAMVHLMTKGSLQGLLFAVFRFTPVDCMIRVQCLHFQFRDCDVLCFMAASRVMEVCNQ